MKIAPFHTDWENKLKTTIAIFDQMPLLACGNAALSVVFIIVNQMYSKIFHVPEIRKARQSITAITIHFLLKMQQIYELKRLKLWHV